MRDFREIPLWILTGTLVAAAGIFTYLVWDEHKVKIRAATLDFKMRQTMYEQMTVHSMEQRLDGPP